MPSSYTNTTASLLLGGWDINVMNGNLTYLPVYSEGSWNTTMTQMKYGTLSIWKNSATKNSTATFIAGYKYIGLPDAQW